MKVSPLAFMALSCLLLASPVHSQTSLTQLPLLLDAMAASYGQPMVVGFGNFTYGYTGVGDSFSRVLEDRLERALTRTKNVSLADRGAIKNMDPNFQEIFKDHFENSSTNGLLYGTWVDSKDGVVVTLKLTELSSRRLLAAEEFLFPYSDFPPATAFVPPKLEEHAQEVKQLTQAPPPAAPSPQAPSRPSTPSLKVDFTTSRGESAVYREGDLFEAFLTLNQDAYVTIYHVDVKGVIQVIFPEPEWYPDNFVKAGSLVQIPPEGSYTLTMAPPFGREYIKVIASTRDIRLNDISGKTLGPRQNLVEMAVRSADRSSIAEDLYWYSIVE
jgi:hypothetical protein